MTTVIKSLDLFSSRKKHQHNSQNNTLLGIHTKELYSTVKTHTVFRQAIDALVENVFMHPLVYCKQNKYADTKLTPQWAITACCEIIDSFWAVGFAAVQIISNRIVVGVPTEFDLIYNTKLQQWTKNTRRT